MVETIPAQFSREMGITFKEFMRTLPAALGQLTFRLDERQVTIDHPQGAILISLHPTTERRIASIRLPLTPVDFSFDGIEADARHAFMHRFDLYFHRGGG